MTDMSRRQWLGSAALAGAAATAGGLAEAQTRASADDLTRTSSRSAMPGSAWRCW
jgi:nitrous oxide reductase